MSMLFKSVGKSAPQKRVVRKNSVPRAKSNVKNIKAMGKNSAARKATTGKPNAKAMPQPGMLRKVASSGMVKAQGAARHTAVPGTKGAN